jgi:hypothetical protein
MLELNKEMKWVLSIKHAKALMTFKRASNYPKYNINCYTQRMHMVE